MLINKSLTRVAAGQLRRLIVNMPPRHGKTEFAARYFPFYYLGCWPSRDVIYVTSTGQLAAEQGEFTRNLIEEFGPRLFGINISRSSKAKDNWDLCDLHGRPTGGSMRCFSMDSRVHGRNAHLLILDDLIGNINDAISPTLRDKVARIYTSSLYTRLTPEGAVVSIGTPFHADDWFGRMTRAEGDGGDKWTRIRLPALAGPNDPLGRQPGEALWPEQGWTVEKLEAIKANKRANGQLRDWQSQYNLTPVSGDGVSEWTADYFAKIYDQYNYPGPPWVKVLAIDPSKGASSKKKGDWQAFSLIEAYNNGHIKATNHLYRLDVVGLEEKALQLIELYKPQAIVVETNYMGYALFERLAMKQHFGEWLHVNGRHHDSKESKHIRITSRLGKAFAGGLIHMDKTPHNQLVVDQASFWPNGDFDDGLDAMEMGMEFVAMCNIQPHKRLFSYKTRTNPHA